MAFCQKCGSQLAEGGTFCAVCGTPVAQQAAPAQPTPAQPEAAPAPEAAPVQQPAPAAQQAPVQPPVYQQPVYQQPVQPAYNPADHTAEFASDDISKNKVVAMAAYMLGVVGIIIALLAAPESPYASFHSRQALKLEIVNQLLLIVSLVLDFHRPDRRRDRDDCRLCRPRHLLLPGVQRQGEGCCADRLAPVPEVSAAGSV